MKVYLYNAISIDGFIAKKDDDTTWVKETDWAEFSRTFKEKKAIIMGRKTAEVSGKDFPYDCELNVVMTHSGDITDKPQDKVWYTDKSPQEILDRLTESGY